MSEANLHLFDAVGVELEYMIVDRKNLDVAPIADVVLTEAAGKPAIEVELGDIAWSNELVLHVLELKTNGPTRHLDGWGRRFLDSVRQVGRILEQRQGMLLPTGMHPWMDPTRDAKLWPHEQNEIYRAYDRIFDTRGHGFVNLQSTHINLPFCGDDEFVRLHAAIRVVLPLIPALAASSPFVAGRRTGLVDNRVEYYRHNQKRIPSITGGVIPEAVGSQQEYHDLILATMYRDIAPFDPENILQHEWLNSRGAIPRFERGAIEIRLLDIQECPRADLALVAAVIAAVKALAQERWQSIDTLQRIPTEALRALLLDGIRHGSNTIVNNSDLLMSLGLSRVASTSMRYIWNHLVTELVDNELAVREGWDEVYTCMLKEGNLAERILSATGSDDDLALVKRVYSQLAAALARGDMFRRIRS